MAGRKLAPERVARVLECLAAGMNPLAASRAAGVPKSLAYALNAKMGGVHRPPSVSYSARYLDREERHEIARLRGEGLPVRQAAARLGRSPPPAGREPCRPAGSGPQG